MLSAVVILTLLALAFGLLLGFAAVRFKVESDPVVDRIDALLPQTQCGQCSYAGCRPYAQAIAEGEADINRCPPGGESTIRSLADLLDRDPKPLDGEPKPKGVALIDESSCIGCTLCIQACPVDAILGAAKQMHTVISCGVHRLRAVHRAVPGGLHHHGAVSSRTSPPGSGRSPRKSTPWRRVTGDGTTILDISRRHPPPSAQDRIHPAPR